MRIRNKAGMAITGAVLATVLGAAGAGVAFATPPAATPSGAGTQATPDDAADPADNDAALAGMDEMMRQMVQDLPAEQRDAATRMHEQMRPAMESMMSGDMAGMDQMGEHHDAMPTG